MVSTETPFETLQDKFTLYVRQHRWTILILDPSFPLCEFIRIAHVYLSIIFMNHIQEAFKQRCLDKVKHSKLIYLRNGLLLVLACIHLSLL